MHRDTILKLIQTIDAIEADMRGLENRMTSVRRQLWQHIGGERSGVQDNGRTDREMAESEAMVRAVFS